MKEQRTAGEALLLVELVNYENQGITIFLEGRKSNSLQVNHALTLHEDTRYMRDYIFEDGSLSELRFDRI